MMRACMELRRGGPAWINLALALVLLWTSSLSGFVVRAAQTPQKEAHPNSPPIKVHIQANWNASPLQLQILTPAEVYQRSLEAIVTSGTPLARDSAAIENLKLSLALKESGPLIETFYQIYRNATSASDGVEAAKGCLAVLDGEAFTSIQSLVQRLPASNVASASRTIFDFDHVYSGSSGAAGHKVLPTVVLYGDIESKDFIDWHRGLTEQADRGIIRYILRWKPSKQTSTNATSAARKLHLSGYGAGLDLKRVDYLTIDDRDLDPAGGTSSSPDVSGTQGNAGGAVSDGSIFDESGPAEMVQLKESQYQELGFQAAQLILQSETPLTALKRLSQDIPKLAYKLSTSWVPHLSEHLVEELRTIHSNFIDMGRSAIWLNGLPLKDQDMKPFSLVRLLRKERRTVGDLQRLGLNVTEAIGILAHPAIGAAATPDVPTRGALLTLSALGGDFFDASDRRTTEAGAIVYLNDLEKDARYKHWPKSLQALMQPAYPGATPQVRRNVINVIFALDFARTDSHIILSEHIATFIKRGLSVRIGVVPRISTLSSDFTTSDGLGAAVAKAFWHLIERGGRVAAMSLVRELAQANEDVLTIDILTSAYGKVVREYEPIQRPGSQEPTLPNPDLVAVVKDSPDLQVKLDKAFAYGKRLGLALLADGSNALGNFLVNGLVFPMDEEFRQNLQQAMQMQMQYVMQQLYLGALDDTDDVSTYFYDHPDTYSSRNPFVFPDDERNPLRFVDVATFESATGVRCDEEGNTQANNAEMSLRVLLDVNNADTSNFLHQLDAFAVRNPTTRICLIHNPSSGDNPILGGASESGVAHHILPKLHRWTVAEDHLENEADGYKVAGTEGVEASRRVAAFAAIPPGSSAIIVNGRVISGFPSAAFKAEDLEALVTYERKKRLKPIQQAIKEVLGEEASSKLSKADLVEKLTSVIAAGYLPDEEGLFSRSTMRRSRDYLTIPMKHSGLVIGNEETAVLQFAVIVDPLSQLAQSWSAILETLSSMKSVSIRLYLNPTQRSAELPVKRFYRYSFAPELQFDANGLEVAPGLTFDGIPQTTLLTLAMDVQHAWQAFPKESVHDLDNIRLSDLKPSARGRGINALFQLDNIIVEGHARENKTNTPPRGLQLLLSDGHDRTYDTLVMANLGYFQLKANPGVWDFGIREGRSSEVFELEEEQSGRSASSVAVTTFEGLTIYPKFRRRPGMDMVDLLDEDEPETTESDAKSKTQQVFDGLKDRLQAFFGQASGETALAKTSNKGAEINIFTVASGLLYERMAMIMILSVLRHTQSSVKFWFINNFLSPSFKAFIPHLAQQYGFDYELVTYTWPRWLRGQTEKQRTIWGYKILFLDVLFPLELDRVVFVDSDQIVRADLKELIDMDLQGAAYAYAPMGDDREEMESFRFWKGGYWANHLRGKPYHISALYVIDLDRFRALAAGDRLRGQYQALSADPHSLANLDQDLPNNMQDQLRIHTLDRSWLWCETWCSDESLKDAKTIDLCNNPKTHEPKLARAKRLIPEWTLYDDEIAALAERVNGREKGATMPTMESRSGGEAGDSVPGGGEQDSGAGRVPAEEEPEFDSAAQAFLDRAASLEQAKMQEKEYVEEGTGGGGQTDRMAGPDQGSGALETEAHPQRVKDEL